MSEDTHGYIGRWHSCECIVAVTVDSRDHPRDTAKDVASFIRDGHRIERHTIEDIRAMPWRCERHPKGAPSPWDEERMEKRRAKAAEAQPAGLGL